MVRFQYRWECLNNMNNGFFGLGKSRARVRFEVARYNPTAKKYQKLKSTPFIKHDKENSLYKIPNQMYTYSQLCNKKLNQKIRFGVYDTRDLEVNRVIVSVNELLEENKFEGFDGSKLIFEGFELYDRPNFLEYLSANWQIRLAGAIDFSVANGNQNDEFCLHNLNESNYYESTLRQISTVIEPYSQNKISHFYGFGAEINDQDQTQSLDNTIAERLADLDLVGGFPINLDTAQSESVGIDELVANYKNSLSKIQFKSETQLAPTLRAIKKNINKQQQVYYAVVLMIAGEISDMEETKELIVQLSHYPCSIIAIGLSDTGLEQFEQFNAPGVFKDNNNNGCVRRMI